MLAIVVAQHFGMSLLAWNESMVNGQKNSPLVDNPFILALIGVFWGFQGVAIILWCRPALFPLIVGIALLFASSRPKHLAITTFLVSLGSWSAVSMVLVLDEIDMHLPISCELMGSSAAIASLFTTVFESFYIWRTHTHLALIGLASCGVFFVAWLILV